MGIKINFSPDDLEKIIRSKANKAMQKGVTHQCPNCSKKITIRNGQNTCPHCEAVIDFKGFV